MRVGAAGGPPDAEYHRAVESCISAGLARQSPSRLGECLWCGNGVPVPRNFALDRFRHREHVVVWIRWPGAKVPASSRIIVVTALSECLIRPLPLPVQRAGGYAAHCKYPLAGTCALQVSIPIPFPCSPTAVYRLPYLMALGPLLPPPNLPLFHGDPEQKRPRSLFFPISSTLFNLRPSFLSWLFLLSIDAWPLSLSAFAASLSPSPSTSGPLTGSQMPLDDTRPSMVN